MLPVGGAAAGPVGGRTTRLAGSAPPAPGWRSSREAAWCPMPAGDCSSPTGKSAPKGVAAWSRTVSLLIRTPTARRPGRRRCLRRPAPRADRRRTRRTLISIHSSVRCRRSSRLHPRRERVRHPVSQRPAARWPGTASRRSPGSPHRRRLHRRRPCRPLRRVEFQALPLRHRRCNPSLRPLTGEWSGRRVGSAFSRRRARLSRRWAPEWTNRACSRASASPTC